MSDVFKTPEKGARSSDAKLVAHLFAGSKGGTGKTSVMFHAAAQWAKDHPDENVLVIDLSFAGDVSERLLGGARDVGGRTVGEAAFEALAEQHKSAADLFRYLHANPADITPAPASRSGSAFMAAFRRMNMATNMPTPSPPPPRRAPLSNVVEKFGVLVKDVNPKIDLDNLHLIAGGASGKQPAVGIVGLSGNDDQIQVMARTMHAHLIELPGKWRVFIDTDGDLDISTSMDIVARVCDTCAMFTETDPSDFRRVRVFIKDLLDTADMQTQATGARPTDFTAKVAVICFNKVSPDPKQQPFGPLGCQVQPHIVAVRELIQSFAKKISFLVSAPNTGIDGVRLFANARLLAPGADVEERVQAIMKNSFLVMQDFMKLGLIANDLGIPFCCINPAETYRGEHAVYSADTNTADRLQRLIKNIQELNERL